MAYCQCSSFLNFKFEKMIYRAILKQLKDAAL